MTNALHSSCIDIRANREGSTTVPGESTVAFYLREGPSAIFGTIQYLFPEQRAVPCKVPQAKIHYRLIASIWTANAAFVEFSRIYPGVVRTSILLEFHMI